MPRNHGEPIQDDKAQVAAYSEEILLSRESEGETMRDLLETREKLESAQAELATATTEIAERDDTIDALRNDIAALRATKGAG